MVQVLLRRVQVTIGDRIVVLGLSSYDVRVINVEYVLAEARWMIVLDWGGYGLSRVYDHDENKTWYRYKTMN